MLYKEMMEKVIKGEIVIDLMGHATNHTYERFLKSYHELIENANGKKDGVWTPLSEKTMEETNLQMRKHFQRELDYKIEAGQSIYPIENVYCFGCGKLLRWTYDDGKLRLNCFYNSKNFVTHEHQCEYENPKPFQGEIQVDSTLVFANIFREFKDSPKEQEYTEAWSLNCFSGREKITKHRAKQNVAYGQMGNMSVGIYVSPNKKSIIVGDPYIADRLGENMTDEEFLKAEPELSKIDGHKFVGRISLAVWRWEATPINNIGKDTIKKIKEDYGDVVKVKVPLGVWEFTHFYDCEKEEPKDGIYAKLKLKDNAFGK